MSSFDLDRAGQIMTRCHVGVILGERQTQEEDRGGVESRGAYLTSHGSPEPVKYYLYLNDGLT